MRLVAAFLLLALPAYAADQAAPPPHKPADHKPTDHKPGRPKPHGKPARPSASQHAKPPPRPAPPLVTPPAEQPPAEPSKGSNSGLPLPRFAALRSDDVNFRSGPGTRYPIEWVYKRRDLPVEIEREFEVWRLVRDPEGSKGWVHQATLTGRRTAVVTGADRVLRQSASAAAPATAKLRPGVILRLVSCEVGSEWCSAQVGDYRGWIKRTEIWGLLPDEVIK